MKLIINDYAPAFSLADQAGEIHSLAQYQGQWILLYFYPKDDTPGCTTEACTLRDNLPKFTNNKVVVLGISKDSVASHAKFAIKYKLLFTLLADETGKVCEAYDALGIMGVRRSSFLIDPAGKIVKIYEHVKPEKHAAEVLADVGSLSALKE